MSIVFGRCRETGRSIASTDPSCDGDGTCADCLAFDSGQPADCINWSRYGADGTTCGMGGRLADCATCSMYVARKE